MTENRHFHVIAGTSQGLAYGESKFDDYEESVDTLTTLSTTLFGHLFEGDDKLTFEKFIEVTENGNGNPIMVGTPHLCICWWPCADCSPLVSN